MPQIETSKDIAARFNVPEQVSFSNWFELYTSGSGIINQYPDFLIES